MEKTLTYIKNWRGSFRKNAKLSHIYHSCCREPSHTHPKETWSMREWPSKWWGTFIVIDKMGGWCPWAESVGLGEEVWWKVCRKFLTPLLLNGNCLAPGSQRMRVQFMFFHAGNRDCCSTIEPWWCTNKLVIFKVWITFINVTCGLPVRGIITRMISIILWRIPFSPLNPNINIFKFSFIVLIRSR